MSKDDINPKCLDDVLSFFHEKLKYDRNYTYDKTLNKSYGSLYKYDSDEVIECIKYCGEHHLLHISQMGSKGYCVYRKPAKEK